MQIYIHGTFNKKIPDFKFKIPACPPLKQWWAGRQNSRLLVNKHSSTFNLQSLIKGKGFTFLEISLVILVIGIVLSLVLPNIGIHKSKLEIEREIEKISQTIKSLYDLAQVRNKEIILSFDLGENNFYAMFSGDEDDYLLPKKNLGSAVIIRDIVNSEGNKITQGIVSLVFNPSGFVESATIHFVDKNSKFYTLSINPLTGQSRVEEGYWEEE